MKQDSGANNTTFFFFDKITPLSKNPKSDTTNFHVSYRFGHRPRTWRQNDLFNVLEPVTISNSTIKAKYQTDFTKWLDSNLAISVNPTLSFPSKMVFSFSSQKISFLFAGFCKIVLSCHCKDNQQWKDTNDRQDKKRFHDTK